MLTRTVVSSLLGTNCHLLADERGRAVVVDPGLGVTGEVLDVVRAEGLAVAGVLVTHGHVDHTWDAADLADALGTVVHVHEADAHRLADPFGTLGPLGGQLADAARASGREPRVPERLRTFAAAADGTVRLELPAADGAVVVEALHLPGHTAGSTAYRWDHGALLLTGDVLFAGTIGRTDLPGGDDVAMAASLRRLAALPGGTVVHPGHGPSTTIAAETASNPFLRTV